MSKKTEPGNDNNGSGIDLSVLTPEQALAAMDALGLPARIEAQALEERAAEREKNKMLVFLATNMYM